MKKLLAAALCLVTAASFAQDTFNFTYAPEGAEVSAFGVGRYVDYDIAIRLNDPSLIGYEIIGITADLPDNGKGTCDPNVSGWISSALTIDENEMFVPDITVEKSTIIDYGTEDAPKQKIEITFSEPYKISGEEVYIGYTLFVNTLKSWSQAYPICVATTDSYEGGLYVHCSKGPSGSGYKYLEWTDLAAQRGQVSTMVVHLRGNRPADAVSPTLLNPTAWGVSASETVIDVTFGNNGTQPVRNIDLEIRESDSGNILSTIHHTFEEPIAAAIGSESTAEIPFTTPDAIGAFPLTIAVTKVNGEENTSDNPSADFNLNVRSWLPQRRPLVEEYTGLWCQGCPSLYVAVAQARDVLGDDFTCTTYHCNDAMMTISPANLPRPNAGQPSMYINRIEGQSPMGLIAQLQQSMKKFGHADVNVRLYWTSEEHTALRAEADLKFVDSADTHNYALTMVMTEDDMSNPNWKQCNSFSTETDRTGKYWDLFVGKGYYVSGLEFQDVVLAAPDVYGMPQALPDAIEGDRKYTATYTFNLEDAVNVYLGGSVQGQNIIIDPNKIRVTAILLDTETGEALNTNISPYSGDCLVYDPATSAVEEISAAEEPITTEIYTLSGLRLGSMPETGAVIVVKHFKDGSVKTAKVLQ